MQIDSVRIEGQDLILTTTGRDARLWVFGFKPGDYEIVARKAKRSLEANAYAWILIDKLAEATGLTKTEVYRNAIREIGGVSETYCIPSRGVDQFCEIWRSNGLGWQAETFPSKLPKCTNVTVYYGSSVYDKAQMSRLIDALVQDCQALDIETMPPDRLDALLNAWEEKHETDKLQARESSGDT